MDALIVGLIAVAFFAIVVVRLATKKMVPLQQRVDEWAKGRGLEVVTAEKRPLDRPFRLWFGGRGATLYRLVVRDSKGEAREAWVRFHFSLFGKDWEDVWWTNEKKNA